LGDDDQGLAEEDRPTSHAAMAALREGSEMQSRRDAESKESDQDSEANASDSESDAVAGVNTRVSTRSA